MSWVIKKKLQESARKLTEGIHTSQGGIDSESIIRTGQGGRCAGRKGTINNGCPLVKPTGGARVVLPPKGSAEEFHMGLSPLPNPKSLQKEAVLLGWICLHKYFGDSTEMGRDCFPSNYT